MKAEAAMGNNSTNIRKANNHLSSQMVLVFRVCLCLFVFCFFYLRPASCVPNIASVSRTSILESLFGVP
jgi:small neutral amino acid transporter SnatA (MarC family)